MNTSLRQVLILDDDEVTQIIGSAIMQRLGVKAMTASSIIEAERIMNTSDIHMMLVDVNLPDKQHRFNDMIKKKINEDVRVIGLVGHDQHGIVHRENFPGLHEMIEKPIDLEKISRAVGS
jgi:DNA-binding NtrC family response regulator